jgi:peptidoglycan hydrolase CwlO-like protein
MAETFTDFMANIKEGLDGIAADIKAINKRLDETENKVRLEEKIILEHERRLDKKREDIKGLKEEFEKHKEATRLIVEIKPTLETIQSFFRWWDWKNWWKIFLVFILVIIFFIGLFISINFYMHDKGWVMYNNPKNRAYKEWTQEIKDSEAKILKAPERAVILKKETDAEIDSTEQNIIRYNIKPVTITYDK